FKLSVWTGVGLLRVRLSRLRQDARTGPMRGLLSRRGLELGVEAWQTLGREFSLALVDIDHFKQVNDRHGHDMGDRVIVQVARLMRELSRDGDALCRLGGEEFLILFPGSAAEDARQGAERLREAGAATDMGLGAPLTVSGGVAAWPRDGETFDSVLKAADQALYRAKTAGRNRIVDAADPVLAAGVEA